MQQLSHILSIFNKPFYLGQFLKSERFYKADILYLNPNNFDFKFSHDKPEDLIKSLLFACCLINPKLFSYLKIGKSKGQKFSSKKAH